MPTKDANGRTLWTTPELLLYVTLSAAGGAIAGALIGSAVKDVGEDDRPPIIVSNGSADFEGKQNHGHYNDANWEKFPPNQDRIFKHVQANGIPVASFSLTTDPEDPAQSIASCTFGGTATPLRPPFTGTSVSAFYSTQANPALMESKLTIDGDELVLTLPEDGELQAGGKKIKVKDVNNSPPNRKVIRSFSIGKYSCVLADQGTTKVVVTQKK